jgi:hypothetical protein
MVTEQGRHGGLGGHTCSPARGGRRGAFENWSAGWSRRWSRSRGATAVLRWRVPREVARAANPLFLRTPCPREPCVKAVLGQGGAVSAPLSPPSSGRDPCVQARSTTDGPIPFLGAGKTRAGSTLRTDPQGGRPGAFNRQVCHGCHVVAPARGAEASVQADRHLGVPVVTGRGPRRVAALVFLPARIYAQR